jgi:pimeloyl-ACP methyl ester carboxylesterase
VKTSQITRTQAGHFVQEEVPDLVAGAIREALSRGDKGIRKIA